MEEESEEIKENADYLKNQKEEEDLQKKFNFNKLKVLNEFKKIKNTFSDDIIPKIKHHKRLVLNSTKILIGDEAQQYNLNFGKTKNSKELQSSKSALDATCISDKAKMLRRKINYHINKVKKSHEGLTSLNGLYLDNTIFPEKNATSNVNNISLINSQEQTSNYNEAIFKRKLRRNFDFISNNYHKKLNFAFSKYNPVTYMNNLKRLIQISPEVREDVSKIKLDVEQDIKHINDKHKFSKLFKKLKTTKNSRKKNFDNFEPIVNKSNDILKNINSNSVKNDGENKKIVVLPILKEVKPNTMKRESRIKNNFFKKLIRKETRKILDAASHQYDEIKQLHSISKEIEKYIDDDNIDKNIDKNVHDFMEFKYFDFIKKKSGNSAKSIFKPKDYYQTQKNKINKMVGELYIKNLRAKIQEEERSLGRKLRIKKDDYFNQINSEMKSSLNEFDETMARNSIDLEKNNEDLQ